MSNDFEEEYDNLSEIEDEEEREELYWDNKLYSYKNEYYNWRERKNPCNDAYYDEDRMIAQNLFASNLGIMLKKEQMMITFLQ